MGITWLISIVYALLKFLKFSELFVIHLARSIILLRSFVI